MLHARDLDETIRFYTECLGFTLEATWSENGEPPASWCALSHGAARIMFTTGDADEPALTGRLYCYPENVDAYYDEVTARGAVAMFAPFDTEYEMREFSLTDPNGYVVSFGRGLER
jgi:predicted enzyme related to lactoylglutathione lyase